MQLFLCNLSDVMPLSGLFEALNDIQFIQKFLQGVTFEKAVVAHRLLDTT